MAGGGHEADAKVIGLVGGAAAWGLMAPQGAMPVIGFLSPCRADANEAPPAGLAEEGYVERQKTRNRKAALPNSDRANEGG